MGGQVEVARIENGAKGIYIAGPISALPHLSLEVKKQRFEDAQALLEATGDWDFVINPLWVVPTCGRSPAECRSTTTHVAQGTGQDGDESHAWECYMKSDLLGLLACSAIALLPGHDRSRGAILELHLAKNLNYRKIYLDTDPNRGGIHIAGGDK